jgi:hypothetical protein
MSWLTSTCLQLTRRFWSGSIRLVRSWKVAGWDEEEQQDMVVFPDGVGLILRGFDF